MSARHRHSKATESEIANFRPSQLCVVHREAPDSDRSFGDGTERGRAK